MKKPKHTTKTTSYQVLALKMQVEDNLEVFSKYLNAQQRLEAVLQQKEYQYQHAKKDRLRLEIFETDLLTDINSIETNLMQLHLSGYINVSDFPISSPFKPLYLTPYRLTPAFSFSALPTDDDQIAQTYISLPSSNNLPDTVEELRALYVQLIELAPMIMKDLKDGKAALEAFIQAIPQKILNFSNVDNTLKALEAVLFEMTVLYPIVKKNREKALEKLNECNKRLQDETASNANFYQHSIILLLSERNALLEDYEARMAAYDLHRQDAGTCSPLLLYREITNNSLQSSPSTPPTRDMSLENISLENMSLEDMSLESISLASGISGIKM